MNRYVRVILSDDSGARGDHFVVMQLDLLLIDLRVQSVQLRLRGIQGCASLIEILPTDYARVGKTTYAFVVLLRPGQLSELGCASVLLVVDRGLLLGGVDLHDGGSVVNMLAGVDEDLRDNAFDLWHDHS